MNGMAYENFECILDVAASVSVWIVFIYDFVGMDMCALCKGVSFSMKRNEIKRKEENKSGGGGGIDGGDAHRSCDES